MLQMDFKFFNVESTCRFTLTFVVTCYTTLYQFGFPSIKKRPPLDIIKLIFTTLRNQDKKFPLIQVNEDGSLARYSEFTSTCHKINIIVKTTGGDEYSLNGKIVIPDKILKNITRDLLLK